MLVNAAWRGHLPFVTMLLSRGADAAFRGGDALVRAADTGNLRVALVMLSRGADAAARVRGADVRRRVATGPSSPCCSPRSAMSSRGSPRRPRRSPRGSPPCSTCRTSGSRRCARVRRPCRRLWPRCLPAPPRAPPRGAGGRARVSWSHWYGLFEPPVPPAHGYQHGHPSIAAAHWQHSGRLPAARRRRQSSCRSQRGIGACRRKWPL